MVKDVHCWEYIAGVNGLETKKDLKKKKRRISCVYLDEKDQSWLTTLIHQSHKEVHRMPFLVSPVYTPVYI